MELKAKDKVIALHSYMGIKEGKVYTVSHIDFKATYPTKYPIRINEIMGYAYPATLFVLATKLNLVLV